MHHPLAHPLVIRPSRSRCLAVFIAVSHGGALVAAGLSGLPALGKAAAMILILVAFIATTRRWRFGDGHGNGRVYVLNGDGTWLRQDPGGPAVPLVSVPPAFAHPCLIVIRLRSTSAPITRHDLVFLPDSLHPDTARRLRVVLRFPR